MSTSKKSTVKITKVAKNARVETKPKAEIKLTADTAITFKSERPDGAKGPKTKLLALVPRKGSITFKALKAKAEAEGLNEAKIAQYMASMAKAGRVELA
jgi:hypothetical protein